jgi:hypothetical protein
VKIDSAVTRELASSSRAQPRFQRSVLVLSELGPRRVSNGSHRGDLQIVNSPKAQNRRIHSFSQLSIRKRKFGNASSGCNCTNGSRLHAGPREVWHLAPTPRKWEDRYHVQGIEGLSGKSRRPLTSPITRNTGRERDWIAALRDHRLGSRRIQSELKRSYGSEVSRTTIEKALKSSRKKVVRVRSRLLEGGSDRPW